MAQLKAGIYLRISKDIEMTGEAIERQREDCEWMCKHYDYKLKKEYVDHSKSAFSGRKRSAYDRMIADYKAGRIDVIVAWKIDRLTRSTQGFAETLNELADQKLCICTTDTGFLDLSRADAKLMVNIFVAFAEFESARKSERQLRANQQRAKNGLHKRGAHCFGYNPDYTINEEQAKIVQRIYSALLEGYSLEAITRALSGKENIDGLPKTPKISVTRAITINKKRKQEGKPLRPVPADGDWSSSSIRGILRNPLYAGYAVSQPWKEWTKPGAMRNWQSFIVRDEHGNRLKSQDHEPIVDEGIWLAVQDILDDPTRQKNACGNNRTHLGSNLFRCGYCGKTVRCSSESYRCLGHVARRTYMIDKYVRALVVERLSDKRLISMYKRDSAPEITTMTDEIKAHRAEIQRAFVDYQSHFLSGSEYAAIKEKHEAEIQALEDKRKEELGSDTILSIIGAENPADEFMNASVVTQAAVIDAFMTVKLFKHPRGSQTFDGTDVHIEWKIPTK